MPVTSSAADALGVVTILLVSLLILLGIACVCYSLYFRNTVISEAFHQLSYFGGPWIIRITFILFIIWWGIWELVRLSFIRGGVLDAASPKWRRTFCKCYVVSNLGFAEPCIFLTLVFLLRAPMQRDEGSASPSSSAGFLVWEEKWNVRTACYVLLFCFPVFVLQLSVVVFGDQLRDDVFGRDSGGADGVLPRYLAHSSPGKMGDDMVFCVHPFLSALVLGMFSVFLTSYLVWLGRKVLLAVINKNLQRRVYVLVLSITFFLNLRVLFLGLSVLSMPGKLSFEAMSFGAFVSFVCCAVAATYVLIYCPVADSLALGKLLGLGFQQRIDRTDTAPLMVLHSSGDFLEDAERRGSISFRAMAAAPPTPAREDGGIATGGSNSNSAITATASAATAHQSNLVQLCVFTSS